MSWMAEHREGLQVGGVVVGLLLLWVLSVGWVGFLVIAGLTVGYEVLLAGMVPAAGENDADQPPTRAGTTDS